MNQETNTPVLEENLDTTPCGCFVCTRINNLEIRLNIQELRITNLELVNQTSLKLTRDISI